MFFSFPVFIKNINTEQKLVIVRVELWVCRTVFLDCKKTIKTSCMESMNISATGNYRKEFPVNLLTAKVVLEKNSIVHKNFSEKKCVHRTETGFCKRSNKKCPLFIFNS
jgi:hypothetical protein